MLTLLVGSAAVAGPPAPTVTAVNPIMAGSRPQAITVMPKVTMVLPTNGDTSTRVVAVQNVSVPPNSDRVPIKLTANEYKAVLSKKPYYCVGTDECRFSLMPYFNQANPNFAYVDAPSAIVAAETSPPAGGLAYDAQRHRDGMVLSVAPGGSDPYFQSWLPYGPITGDEGALPEKYSFSDLCGPTAETMVMAAVIAAKSPSTQVIPRHYPAIIFANGVTPAGQDALPNPLKHDTHTIAAPPGGPPGPGNWQMSADDVQHVINMATYQRTDPTAGGHFDAFTNFIPDFYPHARVQSGTDVLPTTLMAVIRQRYAIVLSLQGYHVSFDDSNETLPGGAIVHHHKVNFIHDYGHALAIDGFDQADTGNPRFFFHDPWFGRAIHRHIIPISMAEVSPASPTNATPLEFDLPDHIQTIGAMYYGFADPPTRIADFKNGDNVAFLTKYWAISVD